MTVRRPEHVAVLSRDEDLECRRRSYRYNLYTLLLESDVALPLDAAPASAGHEPDVRIVRSSDEPPPSAHYGALVQTLRCPCPAHAGRAVMRVYRGDGGCWVWSESAGTTHVSPDGARVTVFTGDAFHEQAVAMNLSGVISTYLMLLRGYPSLHASAVRLNGEAVVFLGPKGRGKSTLAAGLLRRGAALMADDVLPLVERDGTIRGLPGLPFMKLWQSSVEHALDLTEALPNVTPLIEKKVLNVTGRYAVSNAPEPLRALYLLQRAADPQGPNGIAISDISGKEALMVLFEHTGLRGLMLPGEIAPLMPLYTRLLRQAPVRALRYPDGFEHQEHVAQALVDDLRGGR